MAAQPTENHGAEGGPAGPLYGLVAMVIWGAGVPIYLKAVAAVPPLEVMAYRVTWSLVFVALLLWALGRWATVARVLRERRLMAILGTTSLLIAANWVIYILAINADQVLEASLGYFISPLVNIVLGVIFLHERLSRLQWLALALAAAGILNLAVWSGAAPWTAIWLGLTFGFYALLRKKVAVDAFTGLFLELLLLLPVAVLYLTVMGYAGLAAAPALGREMAALLALGGVVTASPLILFVLASKRMKLASLGLLQYLSPTLTFLVAIFMFGEALTDAHVVTFGLIWLALALAGWDASMHGGRSRKTGLTGPA